MTLRRVESEIGLERSDSDNLEILSFSGFSHADRTRSVMIKQLNKMVFISNSLQIDNFVMEWHLTSVVVLFPDFNAELIGRFILAVYQEYFLRRVL